MSSITAAIRPTIRDVRKHPFRSLAAIILIAIPVAMASFMLIIGASSEQFSQLTSIKTIAIKSGTDCEQDYTGWLYTCKDGLASNPETYRPTPLQEDSASKLENQKISRNDITAALGDDFHAELRASATAIFEIHGRSVQESVTQLDGTHLLPGNPDIPTDGVVLTEDTASRLGAKIGDKIQITSLTWGDSNTVISAVNSSTPKTLTVSSISPGWDNYVLAPTLVSDAQVTSKHQATWSISGSREITWQDVKTLNRLGIVVRDQNISQHPDRIDPADMYEQYREDLESSQTDFIPHDSVFSELPFLLFILSFYAVGGLLILAVISPVFAIATSRQTAVYALMRSQGANRRHIRLAVMAYGTIAGLIGGTIGITVGILAALIHWKSTFAGWPIAFNAKWLILSFVLAVIGSTIAAAIPAFLAARGSIMSGVEKSQPDRLRKWRKWMAIGPIGLAVLAIAKVMEDSITYDWDFQSTSDEVLYTLYSIASSLGTLGTVVFLFASVPALIFALGAVRKPLAAKLAGRLIRRQALKSSSIVAAIIGIVFVTTSFIVMDSTYALEDHTIATDSFNEKAIVVTPSTRFHETAQTVPVDKLSSDESQTPSPQIKEALDIVSKVIAPEHENLPTIPLYAMGENEPSSYDLGISSFSLDDGCVKKLDEYYQSSDPNATLGSETARKCRYHRLSGTHSPSWLGGSDSVLIGGVELLQLINTNPNTMSEATLAQATKVLESGGIVGSSAIPLSGDQPFIVETFLSEDKKPKVSAKATVPFSAALPEEFSGWIISPQAAEKLGLSASYIGHAVIGDRPITHDDMTEISERITTKNNFIEAHALNNPMPSPLIPLLFISAIILAIIGLIIVLSLAQVRAQNEQLYALGAPTKLMRRVGGFYLGMMALVGTVPAVVLGHIVAFLLLDPTEYDENGEVISIGNLEFWHIQWQLVVMLCLVVPLIAALMGYCATRSNKYLSYRQD